MEKTSEAVMLPIDVGWSDVGSWASLWEIAARDEKGNYSRGEAVLEDSSDLYVHSERALVATIGVKDLIIVDTPDALLVADKARAQDVSKVVAKLKQSNRKEQEQHLRSGRPGAFRDAQRRRPVPGEGVARETGRQAVDANHHTARSTGSWCGERPR
jgi:mannose-1-phosphate guanylyltransferase/mannose-6-phosphate isomerase